MYCQCYCNCNSCRLGFSMCISLTLTSLTYFRLLVMGSGLLQLPCTQWYCNLKSRAMALSWSKHLQHQNRAMYSKSCCFDTLNIPHVVNHTNKRCVPLYICFIVFVATELPTLLHVIVLNFGRTLYTHMHDKNQALYMHMVLTSCNPSIPSFTQIIDMFHLYYVYFLFLSFSRYRL